MTNTKTVKSKIVYPHLGIVEEVVEELFEEEENKDTGVQEYERSDPRSRSQEDRM